MWMLSSPAMPNSSYRSSHLYAVGLGTPASFAIAATEYPSSSHSTIRARDATNADADSLEINLRNSIR
jgi:hypothetical protein